MPHLLRSEAEYATAVAEIDALLDADPSAGTVASERLPFLSVLVEAYEDERFPRGEAPAGTQPSVVDPPLPQRDC